MKRLTFKNKIAVVTGGCGFFGSQICDALLELKCKVILSIKLDFNPKLFNNWTYFEKKQSLKKVWNKITEKFIW